MSKYAFHKVFEAYLKDEGEPKTWLGVAAFLNIQRNEPEVLDSQVSRVKDSISSARKFMAETNRDELRRGDAQRPITLERLDKLEKFLLVLQERFSPQFEAIRKKAR